MRTYLKYLSRNKLYTFVTVVGFALSLTFVILLGFYVNRENSADAFQPDADRIYQLNYKSEMEGMSGPITTYPAATILKEQMPDVEDVCRVGEWNHEDYVFRPEKPSDGIIIGRLGVDANFFTFFSGYTLRDGDPATVLADKNSAVISESLAQTLFGDKSPIGKEICYVNWEKQKQTFRVTGIMRDMPSNSHIKPMQLLFALEPQPNDWNHGSYWAYLKARPGVNLIPQTATVQKLMKGKDITYAFDEKAQAVLNPLLKCYMEPVGDERGYSVSQRGNLSRIRLFTGTSLLILIIAIISYINLTLAQAGSRGREVSLKKLLGSSRSAIIRQLWSESLILIAGSTVLSIFLVFLLEPIFDKLLKTQLCLADHFTWQLGVIIVLGMLLLSVICALLPALFISRFKPIEVVNGKFRRIVKNRFSRIMVIIQYSITMVMLASTLVIGAQVYFMTHGDLGYDYRHKLMVSVFGLEAEKLNTLVEEFGKLPGVKSVGKSTVSPIGGDNRNGFDIDGEKHYFCVFRVDTIALNAMNIRLPNPPIPSDEISTIYLSQGSIREMKLKNPKPGDVLHFDNNGDYYYGGMVSDIRFGGFKEKQANFLYETRTGKMKWVFNLMVDYDPKTSKSELRDGVRKTYAEVTGIPYVEMEWSEDVIAEMSEEEQSLSGFLLLFSLLALFSTIMSVFAMSALRIRQKQKEVAIRKVVGARTAQILHIISRQSFWNLLIALVAATPIAYYLMHRWMQNYTYHITGYWWAFPVAWVIVAVVAFVSMLGMTLHAANSNPVDYLKNE